MSYWIDFRDQHGERRQERGGSTIAEAVAALARRRAEVAAGTYSPGTGTGGQTLEAYVPRWIELRRREGVRTVEREHQILRDHVVPHLGAKRIADVRPRDIAAWVRALGDAGELAPKSILNAHGVVSAMFARARFDELVTGNPCKDLPRGILPTNVRSRQVSAWTRAELERWITPHPDVPEDRTVAYAIAAFCGARCGEVAGLRWRDLDVDGRPLWRWHLATQYDGAPLKGRGREGGPPRDIPIHPELQRILAAWKLEGWPRFMRRHPRPDDLVVPRERPVLVVDGAERESWVHSKESLGAKAVHRHAAVLGISSAGRDFHSFRRGMITLARTDGAREELLERITHNAAGTQIDGYTYFGWEALCETIALVRLAPLSAAHVIDLASRRDA